MARISDMQKELINQALAENVKTERARRVIKYVAYAELESDFEVIRPTNQYLAERLPYDTRKDYLRAKKEGTIKPWDDRVIQNAISEAKKSQFITTTGTRKSRTFELNQQFLKGKIGEIIARRPTNTQAFIDQLNELIGEVPGEVPGEVLGEVPGEVLGEVPGEVPGEKVGLSTTVILPPISKSTSICNQGDFFHEANNDDESSFNENSPTTSLEGLAKPDTKSSLPGVVELPVKKEKVPLKRKNGAARGLVGRICSMLSKRANRLTEYSDKGRDLMEQIARLDTQKKRAADNITWLLDNGYTKDRILKVAASSMNITRKVTDDSGVEHDLCGNLALYLTVTEDRRDWLVNIMDTWYRPSLAEAKAIAENYAKRDLDALDDDLDDETVD